jgi:predicted acyl esterase
MRMNADGVVYPAPLPRGVVLDKNVPVTMRDGIKPNTINEFQIELQRVFKTFRKGCRIWLKIASDDALYSTWDTTSRYVETPLSPVKNESSIYHDLKHPSHLLLPVIPQAPEIAPVKSPLCDAIPGAERFTQ